MRLRTELMFQVAMRTSPRLSERTDARPAVHDDGMSEDRPSRQGRPHPRPRGAHGDADHEHGATTITADRSGGTTARASRRARGSTAPCWRSCSSRWPTSPMRSRRPSSRAGGRSGWATRSAASSPPAPCGVSSTASSSRSSRCSCWPRCAAASSAGPGASSSSPWPCCWRCPTGSRWPWSLGNSKAAHAGERIFDVDAPGFRAATAFGAIGGAVAALLLVGASMRLSRRRRQVKDLKGQLSERERAEREREEAERETDEG